MTQNTQTTAERIYLLLVNRLQVIGRTRHSAEDIAEDIAAEIDAKDKRITELEQLATLTPIKVGDISITLGLTETGEARMTFDGADDATLAVVAGKFALAMQATMDGAK